MSGTSLPLLTDSKPTTFRDRGLAAPFTTPVLAGARLRLMFAHPDDAAVSRARTNRLELIVPNPSGGRGDYVMPWSEVTEVFRPTVHDVRVGNGIAAFLRRAGAIRPSDVRRISRAVAREGFAGRRAAIASGEAADSDERRTAAALATLTEALRQPFGIVRSPESGDNAVAKHIAMKAARPVAVVSSALQRLAEAFADVGIGATAHTARVPRLMAALHDLVRDVAIWVRDHPSSDDGASSHVIMHAELMITLVQRALAATHAQIETLPQLVTSALDARSTEIQILERPDWLLDGWERICLLWRTAPGSLGRAEILSEMATLVQSIPEEVESWLNLARGAVAGGGAHAGAFRAPSRLTSLDIIARNEHLMGLAT